MRAMMVFFGLRRHINYARYGSLAIINCWPMVGYTRWMESRFSGDTRMIDDPLYLYFVMAKSKANAQQQHLHLVPNVRAIIRKHKQKTEKAAYEAMWLMLIGHDAKWGIIAMERRFISFGCRVASLFGILFAYRFWVFVGANWMFCCLCWVRHVFWRFDMFACDPEF